LRVFHQPNAISAHFHLTTRPRWDSPGRGPCQRGQQMPVVRPTFVGMHDKPASHGFAPTEMRQFAPLGAASVEFSEDRNAAQINKEKRKRLLIIELPMAARFSKSYQPREVLRSQPATVSLRKLCRPCQQHSSAFARSGLPRHEKISHFYKRNRRPMMGVHVTGHRRLRRGPQEDNEKRTRRN